MPEPIRVLHVDDEPGFADMTAEFLERETDRLEVATATSADEGLDRLAAEPVDCIVSDYDMPGLDGLAFLERVRDVDEDIPFVLFTGKGSEEIASEAISAGVTDYLQKERGTEQYAVLANRVENAVEQCRSRRALEASQQRLSLFIDQSPLGVIEWTEEFEVVRANDRAAEILGYDEAELTGMSAAEFIAPDDRERVEEQFDDLLETAGGYHCVNGNVTKDGTRVVCEWHNRVVTDDDGEVVAIFSQFQDITDERRSRQRRQRQQDALVDLATDDAVVEGDFETALRRVTETAADVLDVARVNVWLFEDEGETLACVDDYDRADGDHESGAQLGADNYPTYFEALANNRAFGANDAASDPRTRELSDYLEAHDVGALLDATLRSEGEVVGVVCHEHVGGPREWTDDEVRFAGDVADVVHRALQNRRRADQQRELEFQRSLLAAQQESMLDGLLVVDEAGEVLSFNDRFLEMWGIPDRVAAERDNEALLDAVTDRVVDPDGFRERVASLHHDPTETALDEIELVDDRVFERYTTPLTGEDGTYYGRLATFRDVTESRRRERMAEALHETARDLLRAETRGEAAEIAVEATRDILDMPINGLWFHDADDGVLRPAAWTDHAESVIDEVLQFGPGDGLAWAVFESGEDRHYDDVSSVAGRSNPETDIRSEIILSLGDHGVMTIGSTAVDAFDDIDVSLARTVAAHVETAVDRIDREAALRDERAFIDQALDTLDDLFYVLDSDGEMVRWNDRLPEATGYPDEAIDEMRALEFFPEGERDRVWAAIEETLQEGSATVEAEIVDADGDRVPYEFTGARLTDADGEEIGLVGVGRDVSERRAYERELERQNERLDSFASIVAHDLRNPLNVASARLDLTREDHDVDGLDVVADAHARMEDLIDDLLTLARNGRTVDEPTPVDLAAVARDAWQTVETADATVHVRTDRTVRADRPRLQRLFENLYRNAVEHAGGDATVVVGDLDGGFFVADDGPGIPADERRRVFEGGYSTAADGTGFGLSIVEQIATAHGWDVHVGDAEGGGARLELTGVDTR